MFKHAQLRDAIDNNVVTPPVEIQSVLKNFLINVTQCHANKPFTKGPLFGEPRLTALTTTANLYSYFHDSCLTGRMHFAVQGFPSVSLNLSGLSNAEQAILAGNSYQLTCFGICAWAVYTDPSGDWWM